MKARLATGSLRRAGGPFLDDEELALLAKLNVGDTERTEDRSLNAGDDTRTCGGQLTLTSTCGGSLTLSSLTSVKSSECSSFSKTDC